MHTYDKCIYLNNAVYLNKSNARTLARMSNISYKKIYMYFMCLVLSILISHYEKCIQFFID